MENITTGNKSNTSSEVENKDPTAFKRAWLLEHNFTIARIPTGYSVTGNIENTYTCYFERDTEEEVIDFAFEQIFEDFIDGHENL